MLSENICNSQPLCAESGIVLNKVNIMSVDVSALCLWMFTATILLRIDLIYKSQNALVPYPIMLHSEQNRAHFCSEWSIMGYGTGAFWDLWNWSINNVG